MRRVLSIARLRHDATIIFARRFWHNAGAHPDSHQARRDSYETQRGMRKTGLVPVSVSWGMALAGCGSFAIARHAAADACADCRRRRPLRPLLPPTEAPYRYPPSRPSATPYACPRRLTRPCQTATSVPPTAPPARNRRSTGLVAVRNAANGETLFNTFPGCRQLLPAPTAHSPDSEKKLIGPRFCSTSRIAPATRIAGQSAAEYIYQSIIDTKRPSSSRALKPKLMPQKLGGDLQRPGKSLTSSPT